MSQSIAKKHEILSDAKEEILQELERVLSSNLFARTAVLSNFLKFIVTETLAGNTDSLKEYTIAVSALGKSPDFDQRENAIVRINAGRLRRALDEYYSDTDSANALRIEVVKGTYVPVFRTQETNQKETEVRGNTKPFTRSKLTLAILPFENLLPDDDYQFFVEGFGEELTRCFSDFEEIAVIGYHSCRTYNNALYDVREIGVNLGVHYIVTGSVKRTSKKIRVNIGLSEAMNGMQIWSQTYNHELNIDNLIDIQGQIIKNVCSILGGYYGFIMQKSTLGHHKNPADMASFDAALWNYHYHMTYSEASYLKTKQALEEAIHHDPDFALGMAMLSEIYLDGYSLGFPTADDPINEAYTLAKKAIEINPFCQYGHMLHGWVLVYLKRKEESLESFEYALALNPNSVSVMGAIGFGLACVGEYKRARALLTQSIALNPHCPYWFYLGFFWVHYKAEEYDMALECANKIETPDSYLDSLTKALVKVELGLDTEAQRDFEVFSNEFPEIKANLKAYLGTGILDDSLIDKLMHGVEKAEAFSIHN